MTFLLSVLKALRPTSRDSGVDKLNTKYTVWVLIVAAIVSAVMMWWMRGGITCWTPAYFTSQHDEYAQKVSPLKEHAKLTLCKDKIPQRLLNWRYPLVQLCRSYFSILVIVLWLLWSLKYQVNGRHIEWG